MLSDFKGYGSPQTQRGQASPYGPPPWHMRGRVFTIWYRLADPNEARRHIAPPLQVPDDPICRARFYDIIHDAGKGDAWAVLNPEQTQFHEAVIAIETRYGGIEGDYSVHSYADDATYIAWAREVIGWPLKAGKIHMSRPWSDPAPGVMVTGVLERFGQRLMTASVTLTGLTPEADLPGSLPHWFTYKVIPSAERDAAEVCQLILGGPTRADFGPVWQATATLGLGEGLNDELHFLRPREIVAADYRPNIDISVGYGRILERF
ncbi:MAG: acetoacetate decarboxylase family protein [Anaerolineae bacterium]